MIVDQPPAYLELDELCNENIILSSEYHGELPYRFKKYQNKIIIYSMIGEYLFNHHIESILSNTSNYYIFLTCQLIDPLIIKKYKSLATFINVNNGYSYYSKTLTNLASTDFSKILATTKNKHFLSLNNRASWARLGLFYFFNKYNLLSKSYFSYIGDMSRVNQTIDQMDQCVKDSWYTQRLDLELLKKQIPLYTGLDNFNNNDWGYGNLQYYQESFCSIITETYNFEAFAFFTEKTFKPIAFMQPFLIHGNPGSLKALRNMGFKTFGYWWDESYDELADHERFEKILTIILEISSWPLEKINLVYQDMIPSLEHNHKHFIKTLPALYDKEIIKIKQDIRTIIDNVSSTANSFTL